MLIEILIALIVGVLAGTFTGLFPGIHINLVAAFLLSSLGYFSGVPVNALVIFIVAMSITHTFIDFIPSIFLGAPEEDSFLAVLPGHELLKEGKGYAAVVYTLYGGLVALPIILIFSFIFVKFLPDFFDAVRFLIPYILIFVSLFLIFCEEEWWISGLVFIFAGVLGFLTFNLPVKEPLLPLLSGLFGFSGLVVSLKNKVKIPKQRIEKLREIKLEKKIFVRNSLAAFIAAPLCSFLPGIGSGHAAVLGSEIGGSDRKGFLFLVGALNTIVMALSFVTVYAIGKGRTGSAVAVQKLLEEISLVNLELIIFIVFVSAIIAFFIGIVVAKFFAKYVMKFNYSKLSMIVLGFLFVVNLILSNWIGIIVLITGAALGVFCITSRVRRIQLMGCLLIPSIVYYLV